MNLRSKKRIAASLLKCGVHRVKFKETDLDAIKESITRADVRGLIKDKIVMKRQKKGVSRARARLILKQKRKGRRQGQGSRKGTHNARLPSKRIWMIKIRAIRDLLKNLRDKKIITSKTYHNLYNKAKGGFFRSRRHVKLYVKEHKLGTDEKQQKTRSTATKKTGR